MSPMRLLAALPPPPSSAALDASVLLAALAVPVVLIEPDDRIGFANPAAEQFFGMSFSQLRQLRVADLVTADSPLRLLIDQVRRDEVTVSEYDLTLQSPRLDKTGITVQATPVPDEPGRVLLSLADNSAARSLDRQTTFRSAARSVAGMAAILAHEIKNPLSGIRGAAQLLENTVSAPDRELTELIRDEADRIRALVERMEVFGEKPIERRAVNIHRVLGHVRKLAEAGFAAHLRFAENYDPSLPPVWGNRDQLVQVLLNLVKNAAEAITDADIMTGEITLSTSFHYGVRLAVPGSRERVHLPLVVAVRDNGPGIQDDLRQSLFDPFVTTKPSGSGLGLALVAKIVGDHGGLIEVDSRPGRTEFRLHLPVLQEDMLQEDMLQDDVLQDDTEARS